MPRLLDRVSSSVVLKKNIILLVVVAVGVLLFIPTLDDGFMLDDYYQLAHLEDFDRVPEVGPLSIYTFADGKLNRLPHPQGDVLPWWADENLKIDFFRPLAGILHHLDHGCGPWCCWRWLCSSESWEHR